MLPRRPTARGVPSSAAAPFLPSAPAARRGARAGGVPVIGLEPSCLLGFRDEVPAMIKNADAERLAAHALTFEEFLQREAADGRFNPALAPTSRRVLVHGHCHQKSFDAFA